MEYVKAMKIKARMCKKSREREDTCCAECLFSHRNNGKYINCDSFVIKYPAEAETILTKWDAENPVKTMMDDFFEKHPNAPKRSHTEPHVCPHICGYVLALHENCKYANGDCLKCWSRPLQEESK